MKKLLILFFFMTSLLYSQTTDDYQELLNDYESSINDYEKLLIDYEKLHNNHKTLTDNYEIKNDEFNKLTILYEQEIVYHSLSIKTLTLANKTIKELEGSIESFLKITDMRFMTIFIEIGYLGDTVSVGIDYSVEIPKLPISMIVGVDYFPTKEQPINIQIGAGFRL